MLAFCQPTGIVALAPGCSSPYPASPILMDTKRFLLACRPCRGWHKSCVSCGSRRRDGQAGRSCILNRLTAQHHGLCFDDHGAAVPWDTRAVVGRQR
jgi:hypothetical protein